MLLAALVSAAALCFGQTVKPSGVPPSPPAVEYNPSAWREFSSEKGRFSVLLPGTPFERTIPLDTKIGKLDTVNFILGSSSASYAVSYIDYPVFIEDPSIVKRALDAGRDGAVQRVQGTLIEEKEISLSGHPGRYIKVRVGEGGITRSRLYVVGKRVYTLIFIVDEDGASATAVRSHEDISARFLDSFKLLESAVSSAQDTGAAKGHSAESAVEGEVDRLVKDLREKGESVFGVCEEGTKCQPLPDIEGGTAEDVKKGITIKVISKPPPVYPPIAKAARAQGTVTVQVVVSEEGKVIAAQVVSGHPLLQATAVKAARAAVFSPTLLGTKPVKISGVITYNFVLE